MIQGIATLQLTNAFRSLFSRSQVFSGSRFSNTYIPQLYPLNNYSNILKYQGHIRVNTHKYKTSTANPLLYQRYNIIDPNTMGS